MDTDDIGKGKNGGTRWGQMCKKQFQHEDLLSKQALKIEEQALKTEAQALKIGAQDLKIGAQDLKIEAQEHRLEQQERKMTWLLQQRDHALPLQVGDAEPSEH